MFTVKLFIRNASLELRDLINRTAKEDSWFNHCLHETSFGDIVVSLVVADSDSLKQLYVLEPNKPMIVAYAIPQVLQGVAVDVQLEESESSERGSYCTVVTNYDGGLPAAPYRRYNNHDRHTDNRQCGVGSVFSQPVSAGRVTVASGSLTVTRARVVVSTDPAAVNLEYQVLDRVVPPRLSKQFLEDGFDDPDMNGWNASVSALHERLRCRDSQCRGHYHKE